MHRTKITTLIFATFFCVSVQSVSGQQRIGVGETLIPGKGTVQDQTLIQDVDAVARLHAKFKKLLTGAKLTGQFTVDGKPLSELQEESYEIEKVEKLADGDLWAITARIKYGKHDLTVPVPLAVKWAGTTPILTLDDLTIPGFGTFSARVVLHKDKYAGTWQHDAVGGHLFGMIQLAEEKPQTPESTD